MPHDKAFITGLAGTALAPAEKDFIKAEKPWGFVLFARNIENAAQIKALTASLREISGRPDAPIFVDQEGGRVQRLRPPLAPLYPAAARLGALYARDKAKAERASFLMARLIALDLAAYGFSADFLPLLDVPARGSHNVIGDRAYAAAPEPVIALARAAAAGLRAGGLWAVGKHIPGHGRAGADTHKEPARVSASAAALRASDFAPFKALADLPAMMTAHVIYEAYDRQNPATLSAAAIREVIRGEIGFAGLLMSDDLSMQALPGSLAERAENSFAAGCDMVLHCNGVMAEMVEVAARTPVLAGAALARAAAFMQWRRVAQAVDESALRAEFAELMAAEALA